jgi:hypothetical protein
MRVHRLKELREAIAAVEGRAGRTEPSDNPVLSPGVHEWFLDWSGDTWAPPLGVLVRVIRETAGHLFWIGRKCWPNPDALGEALLRRSVFVDPPDDAERLWAIDQAARIPGVVVADGSGLDMAASRRLQLACEAGGGLVLCARPAGDLRRLSAAMARWVVRHVPDPDGPRWSVEMVRFKGKWKHAGCGVVVHAALVGGPGPPRVAAGGGTGDCPRRGLSPSAPRTGRSA